MAQPPNFSALLGRQRSFDSATERMEVSKDKYFKMAKEVAQASTIDCEEAWRPIAWSIDLVQHILEEQNAGKREKGAQLSHEFFISAYSINVTVQQRAMRGAQLLYERYTNEVRVIANGGSLLPSLPSLATLRGPPPPPPPPPPRAPPPLTPLSLSLSLSLSPSLSPTIRWTTTYGTACSARSKRRTGRRS